MWWWGNSTSGSAITGVQPSTNGTISTGTGALVQHTLNNGIHSIYTGGLYQPSIPQDALKRLQSEKEEQIITVFVNILKYVDQERRMDFLKELIPFISFMNVAGNYDEQNIGIILEHLDKHLQKVDYNKNFKQSLKD
jgi:hypothetical protein